MIEVDDRCVLLDLDNPNSATGSYRDEHRIDLTRVFGNLLDRHLPESVSPLGVELRCCATLNMTP